MPETTDPTLAAFLAGRDHPCPQCEYNLRDLQGTRCPECGEELVLRVNMAEPRQRLLLGGLIGLSSGAGFNGLLIVYVMLRFGSRLPPNFWSVIFFGFCVFAGLIFFWLRNWRRLRRRGVGTRLILVMTCWVLTLIDIVLFSITIR
jgi:hypothetical protein